MFFQSKEKQETNARERSTKLKQAEIQSILRTVPHEKAFHFYEEIGKPTGQVATSLLDFRNKISTVPSTCVVFHLKRKDFENWIRKTVRDSQLAEKISNIDPNGLNLKTKLYVAVDTHVRELKRMLPTPIATSEALSVAPHFPKTELSR